MSTRVIFPLFGSGGGGDMSRYATGISMTIDNDYIISCYLVNSNGEMIGTEQTVDLPLESVVVNGSYDSQTKSLVLTLENGNTITIPVSDLVSGLQAEITAQNPLNADLLTDGTTNKVFTATEQTKLAGLNPQVQSDWNQSDTTAIDYIKNKPTIPAAQVNSDWNASSGVAEILNKPDLTSYATKTEVNTKDAAQDAEIATKIGGVFMTQAEFESITPVENVNYFVENTTVEMVVTFTDQTTATYNVVVE